MVHNSNIGGLVLQFWHYDSAKLIVIDDFLPCICPGASHMPEEAENTKTSTTSIDASENDSFDVLNQATDGSLWIPVLEKGLAKFYGSYAAIRYVQFLTNVNEINN